MNRDEIERVGPTTSRFTNLKKHSPPMTTGLHIVTKANTSPTSQEKTTPSLSPRAQVQQVHSQVSFFVTRVMLINWMMEL